MIPRIALTLGDVAGIGPEIVARAVIDGRLSRCCQPVVVGHPKVFRRAMHLIGAVRETVTVASLNEIDWSSSAIPVWNPSTTDASTVPIGEIHPRAGQAAYDYLVASTRATLAGELQAITTAPLNKAALHAAGLDFPGHTEILARECGVAEYAMMLFLPPGEPLRGPFGLGVAHVTLHTSIRSVPGLLTSARIQETIQLIDRFLKRIGCQAPRVGVCALNPHGGEGGLFGDEEGTLIAPAVEAARRNGIDATGPIPADALLRRAVYGEFDGVAAMYHDQGHIALKLIGFERAVNVTLGLPIVRCSPSHGTAFDIAWQGKARADGFLEAVQTAAELARHAPDEPARDSSVGQP
ncbi:MAG: 4-hydroxythreonine-4-phosphate dehydrogenase PdxA [Planctomycetes bacterium]|nr:4-hydroxythreonine-4-phosphate dehydrogenase PdxA [Planctomycetota bacterium]